MATCNGCGGDNAPGAARCQYCDQPLLVVRTLELDWDVRTGGGAGGRGRLRLQAPTTVSSDAARAAVEAAFGAAVAALGPEPDERQVEAHMRERLPALLPAGCALDLLSVESVSAFVLVGGAPRAQGSSGGASARGCSLGCMALAAALCCLPWGLLGPIIVLVSQEDLERLRQARVVTTTDAVGEQAGVVALQGVVATVGSDAPVSPDGFPCLWLSAPGEGGRTVVEKVASFRVGELVVEVDDATSWDHAASFTHEVGGRKVRYDAIRADRPILLVGPVAEGGELMTGGKVHVSTRPTRDELVQHLAGMQRFVIVVTVLGLLVPAVLLALWLRRGRSS